MVIFIDLNLVLTFFVQYSDAVLVTQILWH